MGKVKQLLEDKIEAGEIDPQEYDGPGNPDTVGFYPGEPVPTIKQEESSENGISLTDVPF